MRKVSALVTATVLAAAPLITAQAAHAQTLAVGGTEVNVPGVVVPGPGTWFDGEFDSDPTVVNYPASMPPLTPGPAFGSAVATGVGSLNTAINTALDPSTDPVVVIGTSQGSLVIDDEQNILDGQTPHPPASDITFVATADPQAKEGIFTVLFPVGTDIPVLDYVTQDAPTNSPYNTVEVNYEYDPIGNFPDRPWDIVADIDAVIGLVYDHIVPLTNLANVPSQVTTYTNSNGGTVTNYLVQAPLPITELMTRLGVPAPIVNGVNKVLTPIVNYGYSDLTPNAGPYLNHGELVTNTPKIDTTNAPKAPAITTNAPKTAAITANALKTPAITTNASKTPAIQTRSNVTPSRRR